jgi:hypothetical protein
MLDSLVMPRGVHLESCENFETGFRIPENEKSRPEAA